MGQTYLLSELSIKTIGTSERPSIFATSPLIIQTVTVVFYNFRRGYKSEIQHKGKKNYGECSSAFLQAPL
tara:strand:+ start:2751 stop:2960 length:210 start_codon:yes stop_codon:yes gene_type:complete